MGRHVGVDATCWLMRRGFGRHARGLLTALVEVDQRNRYTFFVDSDEAVAFLPAGAAVRVVEVATPTIMAASAHRHRSLKDVVAMSRALSAADLDDVLFPTLYSYVPVFGSARRFLIVHDATGEKYPTLAIGNWKDRLFWSAKVALGCRQADVLVTVSRYSRDTIAAQYGIPVGRLHIVGEASDPVFRVLDSPVPTDRLHALGYDATRRSIVYVGGFSPHKQLDTLIRVFHRLSRRPECSDVDVLLVGDYEQDAFLSCYESIANLVGSLDLRARVIFTGYLPDEDLVVLLNLATVLVIPSLAEGFGLPALEAAACGCPVVATKESPLPDILGDGGLYFDPRDAQALEDMLAHVLESRELRRQMREAGIAAARMLSWDSAARLLVDLIEDGASP